MERGSAESTGAAWFAGRSCLRISRSVGGGQTGLRLRHRAALFHALVNVLTNFALEPTDTTSAVSTTQLDWVGKKLFAYLVVKPTLGGLTDQLQHCWKPQYSICHHRLLIPIPSFPTGLLRTLPYYRCLPSANVVNFRYA